MKTLEINTFRIICNECGSTDCIIDVTSVRDTEELTPEQKNTFHDYHVFCQTCANCELIYTG